MKRGNVALLIILLSAIAAPAHEGHDHGAADLAQSTAPTLGAPIKVSKETQFLLGVRTAPAVEETLPERFSALGTVQVPPHQHAVIHPPFAGQLAAPEGRPVAEIGQAVTAGEVLAVVEQILPTSERAALEARLAEQRSALRQAEQEAALAHGERSRVEQLGDAASGKRLAEARSAAHIASEKVAGLREALQELEQSATRDDGARFAEIRSPLSGLVVASHVTPGEFADPQKVLYEIVDPTHMHVEADIYEADLAAASRASTAQIRTQAWPDRSLTGALRFIGQRLAPHTRTVKAYFDVDNREGLLREGMFVDVYIESEGTRTGVIIPKGAVVNNGGQQLVYVKTAPETFIARPVEIVGTWDTRVMLAQGVTAGEIVVVQGTYQIRASARSK